MLGPRQLEDRAVDQLHRRGLERERGAGGRDRVGDRREVADGEHPRLGQRDEADLGLGDRDQRALGAGHELGEVELARHAVEPVAARLAPVPGVAGGDRLGVVAQDVAHAVLEVVGPGVGPERGRRAVGQDDLQLVHVVDRGAVDDRVAARGVVADHPADRGPVGGARVGPEAEAAPLRRAVEVLLHDARADPHAPRIGVDLADRVHVARRVEHDAAAAGALAGEAGAPAARYDRHVEAAGDRDRGGDVGGVARERDNQRLARVHARVARVQVTRIGVRAHVAAQLARQCGGELATRARAPL